MDDEQMFNDAFSARHVTRCMWGNQMCTNLKLQPEWIIRLCYTGCCLQHKAWLVTARLW